ncbi:MAG: response regulator [Dongiaceae bacterium]
MSNADRMLEPLQGLRILILEDDPLICLDLETSLSELGARVRAVSSAAAALQELATSDLDFAVLDFELGAETSDPVAIAAEDRRVPFVFLSGYSKHDERFSRWPNIDVLTKPIFAETIAQHIRGRLGHQP